MANFCGHCGTPNEGSKFCTTCGRPQEPAPAAPDAESGATRAREPRQVPLGPAPPAAPMPPPQPQPAWTPPPAYPPQGYAPSPQPAGPARPATPAVNPFAGVPVGDYVRDALAVFFLFAALPLPWDVRNDGADRWWVVLAVLISVGSLVVPYVVRARVVPGWTAQHARITKLAANVPFLAAVAAALVNELVHIDDLSGGGLGLGIAMGLFGSVLAMQPRQADEDPRHGADRPWNLAATATAVVAVALGVIAFVAFFLDDLVNSSVLLDEVLTFVALVLSVPVLLLVVLGWPAAGAVGGSAPWRRVFATSAITALVAALLSRADDGDSLFSAVPVERWNSPTGGTFLLGAAAALAICRPQQRLGRARSEPVLGWVHTAAAALNVSGVGFLVSAVVTILMMVERDVEAGPIVITVLLAASGGAALVAASMLGDVRRNLKTVLALACGILLVAVITAAVAKSQDVLIGLLGWGVSLYAAPAFFGLPVLAVYALSVPREVRAALGPLFPETGPTSSYPSQGHPGYPAPPAQPPYPQAPYPPQGYPPQSYPGTPPPRA